MTSPIDVAYVDIVANDKSLRKMRKDIDKSLDAVDKDVLNHLEQVEKSFDNTFEDIDKHFAGFERRFGKKFDDIADHVDHTLKDIDANIDDHERRSRGRFRTFAAAIGDAFQDVGRRVTKSLGEAFGAAGQKLGQILGGIGQFGGQIGSLIGGSPMLALILALTPAIIALAAALSQLIGLVGVLPSGLGVLVAAIVPVVVAFQNFGDAVGAIAEGDIDKINEAMKKLSPSAAFVAREIGKLLPQLRTFQRVVQETFFFKLRGTFTQLVTSFLPVLTEGFRNVNLAVGDFIRQLVNMLTTQDSLQVFAELFASTARIIQTLTGPVIRLFDAINASVHESLPFVERIAAAFGRALDAFGAFLNKSIESGAFDKFIEDAFTTVKELVDLLKAVGGLIGTIFSGTEEAGHDFIQTLTDIITRLDKFFQSAEGQDVLRDLTLLVEATGVAIGALVTSFVFLDQQFRVTLAVFEKVGRALFSFGETTGGFFDKIPAKFEEFKAFLGRIPEAIVEAIKRTFDTIFAVIGTQIGLILFSIQVLPQKIHDFFATLPERIGSAVSATGPTLLEIFKKAFDDVLTFITLKFAEIVEFIRSVPDRIIALVPIFLRAGKNLIESFMNGFRSVGSFIGDIAGDIVGAVKGFLNRAIDKINSGIASIDAILPGDLGRIPRLAAGAVIKRTPGGILANVGEGREDEVVSPISTLEDIIRKFFGGGGPDAGGMTVNFSPGSISISFDTVPTEGEARSAGAAVADGIVAQLARRSVRTQVRAA